PETFMYHDVATGHEVWKMSDTPLLTSIYHNDIGVSPWSADGKRLAFKSAQPTQAGYSYSQGIWFVASTTGLNLRPTVEAANRGYHSVHAYFEWSPQEPDVYYEIGYDGAPNDNELYRTRVTDAAVSTARLFTLPESVRINKMVSSDGRKVLLTDSGDDTMYPTTVFPVGSETVNDADGYATDRDLGLYGGTPDPITGMHNQYYPGDGTWWWMSPSGASPGAWWRLKTIGSAADGGPLYNNADYPVTDPNYDFGEAWPENTTGGTHRDPFGSDYWSHFVPDMWGRYALHSSVDASPPGPGVWDIVNHRYKVYTFGNGAQHHDWHGFTDWIVSSGGPNDPTGRAATQVLAANINDPNSQFLVNNAYSRYDGGTAYSSLVRPGQSPDGTKAAWHSEYLNGTDAVDIFWSVVMYPYPPTDLAAAGNGGSVSLSFLPPTYTDRRWINPQTGEIDEVNGEVLYAREVKRYRLWSSSSPTSGWSMVKDLDASYANDTVTNTLKPTANAAWVSPANKLSLQDAPGDGTWYYALTTEEHSGLESDALSEILRVTVQNGSVSSSQVVQAKGQRDFWRSAPPAPSSLSVTPGTAAGHFRLDWTEPTGSTTRYYNIYSSSSGNPTATQSSRIASLPSGTSTYLDWLAPVAMPSYGITAVDRYGNESPVAYIGGSGTTLRKTFTWTPAL
ncbi:MAG: hypothetical protein AAB728_04610, partial [Patescibacteria group bacterium]